MKTNGLANVAVVLVLVFSAILPTAGFVLPTAWSITAQPQHCVHVEQHVQQRRPIGPALHAHRARGRVVGGSCPLQLGTSANEGQDDGAQSDRNIYPNDPGSGEASKGIYGFDEEIIAREAVEAPFRKIRLVAYGVFAAAALALGGISAAGLAGVEEFKELGQNLPNPLIDLGVLGLSFYLWVEEVRDCAQNFMKHATSRTTPIVSTLSYTERSPTRTIRYVLETRPLCIVQTPHVQLCCFELRKQRIHIGCAYECHLSFTTCTGVNW